MEAFQNSKWIRASSLSNIFHDEFHNIFDFMQGMFLFFHLFFSIFLFFYFSFIFFFSFFSGKKGELGNCFAVSAVHAVLEYINSNPYCLPLIFEVFGLGQKFPAEKLKFRFFRENKLEPREISDYILVNKYTGHLIFGRGKNPNHMWAPLFEKALLYELNLTFCEANLGGLPETVLKILIPPSLNNCTTSNLRYAAVFSEISKNTSISPLHAYTITSTNKSNAVRVIDPRLWNAPYEPDNQILSRESNFIINNGVWDWSIQDLPEDLTIVTYHVDDNLLEQLFYNRVQKSFWVPTYPNLKYDGELWIALSCECKSVPGTLLKVFSENYSCLSIRLKADQNLVHLFLPNDFKLKYIECLEYKMYLQFF